MENNTILAINSIESNDDLKDGMVVQAETVTGNVVTGEVKRGEFVDTMSGGRLVVLEVAGDLPYYIHDGDAISSATGDRDVIYTEVRIIS